MTQHQPHRDVDLHHLIASEFEGTPGLNAGHLAVVSQAGQVTLTGWVLSDRERRLAEEAARRVAGVDHVQNEVTIRGQAASSDNAEAAAVDQLTHGDGLRIAIEAALIRSAALRDEDIGVTAEGGHATLTGSVHSWAQVGLAGAEAWSAPGVTEVSNHLEVTDPGVSTTGAGSA